MQDWGANKSKVLARLRRVEGQVRAVSAMVEREEECEQVVQQLAAARKALDRAFFDLMACVTQKELTEAGVQQPEVLSRLAELNQLLARYG